jgi:hypothetical protein
MSRKNSPARKVRRAYSQDTLARICTLPEAEFGRAFGMATIKTGQPVPAYRSFRGPAGPPEDYYHFRDNGSRVLAVAHLDTVVAPDRRTPHFTATQNGPLITCGALDDRLGAYVILDLLPKLGVTCDWLLTVGEESCQSTAEFFTQAKDYDWLIEFDRGGTDVVMYQYEDRASRAAVEASGAVMGSGSFSDVAALEHLGVKGFNWGVGYRGHYHSEAGYAYLNDTFTMVAQYLRFHAQNAGTAMPHDPGYHEDLYGRQDWLDDERDYYANCDSCGEKDVVDSATWYCTFCGVCADCGRTDPDVVADWNDPDVEACQCYTPARQRETLKEALDDSKRWMQKNGIPARDETDRAQLREIPAGLITGELGKHWTDQSWNEYVASGALSTGNAEAARQRLVETAAEADAEDGQDDLDAAYAAAMERDGDPADASIS